MHLLHRAIEERAAEQPDATAVSLNHQHYTYAQMNEAICRLRSFLASRGVKRGDFVAILLPNSPHFVIAHFAVLGLGAVSVPINIQLKARELSWQLDSSEAKTVIGWSKFRSEVEKAVTDLDSVSLRIYLGDEIPEGAESLNEILATGETRESDPSIQEDDLAAVLYTAGTGGKPCGVELTHGNFLSQTRELGRMLRVRPSDRLLGVMPFSMILGLTTNVHLPLWHGGQLIVHSRFHAGDALRSIEEEGVTIFAGHPFMFALMATFPSAEKCKVDTLRQAISCGDKLSTETASRFIEVLKIPICEGYGTTESTGIISCNNFPGLSDAGSVGQAIGGCELTVFRKDGNPADPHETGRVALRGPMVMRGYRHRPDRSSQVIRDDGWLYTGDLGYLDPESSLTITGHTGDVITKAGFPIHPREIEEVLEGLPHIERVGVVGIPDPVFGEDIKACVVLKDGASINPSEIIEYVKQRVALYKCPKLIRFVKELPLAPNGRIIRSQLREDAAANH